MDSHARYIDIHGTNEEYKLGTPASHGCIRMSNADVVELFKLWCRWEPRCGLPSTYPIGLRGTVSSDDWQRARTVIKSGWPIKAGGVNDVRS